MEPGSSDPGNAETQVRRRADTWGRVPGGHAGPSRRADTGPPLLVEEVAGGDLGAAAAARKL
jgi:hypothetical protein